MLASLRDRFRRRPSLSIVVVVYRMPEQAERTLHSLSASYQVGVGEADYEVIVVENASDRPMGRETASRHGSRFRYHYREEDSRSPVAALNFGVARARGGMLALMIDGARMVTPGLVKNVLRAARLADAPVVSVPGYHLGREIQQEAVDSGYGPAVEAGLLRSVDWPADGYDLFEIACLSGSCRNGFFRPYSESNCLAMPRWFYHDIGGCDPRFDLPGGGNANLDLYRRACDDPRSELFVLPGEGSFHQFHGGVTTNVSKGSPERQGLMAALNEQYASLRGEAYSPPSKQPVYLGSIPPQAHRFVRYSAERASS